MNENALGCLRCHVGSTCTRSFSAVINSLWHQALLKAMYTSEDSFLENYGRLHVVLGKNPLQTDIPHTTVLLVKSEVLRCQNQESHWNRQGLALAYWPPKLPYSETDPEGETCLGHSLSSNRVCMFSKWSPSLGSSLEKRW